MPDDKHFKENCPQEDRLVRIEEEAMNHKDWRRETTNVLGDINIQLATLNERVKSIISFYDERLKKYDDHVTEGKSWRMALFSISLTVLLNIGGTVWWGATINSEIHRLNGLHPYGTQIEPINKDVQ